MDKVAKKKVAKKKVATKKPRGNPNPKNQFTKGNKFGKGRPTLTPEQKALALTTRTQFKTLMSQYASYSEADIMEALESNSLSVLDMAVLKHLLLTLQSGSMDRIDWTTNHIMGKPKEETNINLRGDITTTTVNPKDLTREELLVIKAIHDKKNAK